MVGTRTVNSHGDWEVLDKCRWTLLTGTQATGTEVTCKISSDGWVA